MNLYIKQRNKTKRNRCLCREKNKDLFITSVMGYKAGIVFAESHQSELGNRLSTMNPELDFIAMITQRGISYRTIKDNVNVSEITKHFGVGCHPKTSGCPIPNGCLESFIENIFKIVCE